MGVMSWLDPHVDKYILTTAGEQKVLEVKKHWAASAWAGDTARYRNRDLHQCLRLPGAGLLGVRHHRPGG